MIGTNSNENGAFNFYFPEEITNDSIVISCLGYKSKVYAINSIVSSVTLQLEPFSFELATVVVRPLLPTDYIRMAMRKLKENYPTKPFQSQGYYREQITENTILVKQNEGVFKTYYPNYQDTVKNQHQLLLYRKADQKQIAFMRVKAEKKNQKKLRKAMKAGKDTTGLADADAMKIGFGGPESVLGMDFIKEKEPCLDSTKFKKFNYSFGGSSSYEGKELMIINFESLHSIDNMKQKGKIYLDVESLAITALEYKGDIEIPLLIKPVLFLYGFSVEKIGRAHV